MRNSGFHVYGVGLLNGDRSKPLYVGQTKMSLSIRWSKHKSSCKLHPVQNLHRYIVANGGVECFEMYLIERVESESVLSNREVYHIKNLMPPLNVQHNRSNKQKIQVENEYVTNDGFGPFTFAVWLYKWLLNDLKNASELLRND
jgi:hypothetical protein